MDDKCPYIPNVVFRIEQNHGEYARGRHAARRGPVLNIALT